LAHTTFHATRAPRAGAPADAEQLSSPAGACLLDQTRSVAAWARTIDGSSASARRRRAPDEARGSPTRSRPPMNIKAPQTRPIVANGAAYFLGGSGTERWGLYRTDLESVRLVRELAFRTSPPPVVFGDRIVFY